MASTRAKQTIPKSVTVTLTAGSSKLQYCEGANDPYRLLHQGLCAVVRVAQCDDPRYALQAGEFLVEYASNALRLREERKALRQAVPAPAATGGTREQVIAELRGLYAKALGTAPLVVEAQPVKAEEPA